MIDVIILAGGKGTRLAEYTRNIPKPMVKIGKYPILYHIIMHYAFYGSKNFYICTGYKGNKLYDYFKKNFSKKFNIYNSFNNKNLINKKNIFFINTGLNTQTGGRILRLKKYFVNKNNFMLTYGDGLSNINIKKLIAFHKKNNKICTVSAVRPLARFGALEIKKNGTVKKFVEKPIGGEGWINGGFFVCKNQIFNYLFNDQTVFEKKPLERLALEGQLNAYRHKDFWSPMDTLRDKLNLEKKWKKKPKWKLW